jgi:hypothetical protein
MDQAHALLGEQRQTMKWRAAVSAELRIKNAELIAANMQLVAGLDRLAAAVASAAVSSPNLPERVTS